MHVAPANKQDAKKNRGYCLCFFICAKRQCICFANSEIVYVVDSDIAYLANSDIFR